MIRVGPRTAPCSRRCWRPRQRVVTGPARSPMTSGARCGSPGEQLVIFVVDASVRWRPQDRIARGQWRHPVPAARRLPTPGQVAITFRGDGPRCCYPRRRRRIASPTDPVRHRRHLPLAKVAGARDLVVRERVRDRAAAAPGGGPLTGSRATSGPDPGAGRSRSRPPPGWSPRCRGGGGGRERRTSGWDWPANWPVHLDARCCSWTSCEPTTWRRPCAGPREPGRGPPIPPGPPVAVPDDGRLAAGPRNAGARRAHRRQAASPPPPSEWRCGPGTPG